MKCPICDKEMHQGCIINGWKYTRDRKRVHCETVILNCRGK